MAEKMADINRMIHELEDADIDDDGVCVRYFLYKSDVPILVNALKMYRGFMAENKMEVVAALFGERLNHNFKIKHLKSYFKFTNEGLMVWVKEAGCYLPVPYDLFMDLLRGKREIKQGECGDC
jgi:hypothetical protein